MKKVIILLFFILLGDHLVFAETYLECIKNKCPSFDNSCINRNDTYCSYKGEYNSCDTQQCKNYVLDKYDMIAKEKTKRLNEYGREMIMEDLIYETERLNDNLEHYRYRY